MEISVLKLTELLILSFLLGAGIGVINDANRIVRVFFGVRYSSNKFKRIYSFLKISENDLDTTTKLSTVILNLVILVQDFSLTVISGVCTIFLNYYFNDGKIRLFSVLAIVFGFVIYYFTIGKLVMVISEPIMLILREAFKRILWVILFPFKMILKTFINTYHKIYELIKKYLAKRINMRYNTKEVKRLLILSKIGFINYKEFGNEG